MRSAECDASRVLDPACVPPVPWANGAGLTRPLVVEAHWRLSLAELTADAPFSVLLGVERLFLPLGALTLDIDGARVDLEAYQPARFAGESTVTVRLSAPTRALNVMTPRGRLHGDVVLRPVGTALAPDAVAAVDLGDVVAEIHLVEGPA